MRREKELNRLSQLSDEMIDHIMTEADLSQYKNRLNDLSDCDLLTIICYMDCYKYYRLFASDCWYDGESWSANDIYEQAVIVAIHDEASDKSIIKSLKKAGILPRQLQYARTNIEGDHEYSLYVEYWYSRNREPIMLELRRFNESDLEHESACTYGMLEHRQTKLYIASKK